MRKRIRIGLIALGVSLLSGHGPLAYGQEHSEDGGAAHGEATHEEGEHKNHLSVFVGITDEEAESSFSLGLDYERRLTRVIGVGGFADYAFGDIRALVLGAALFVHPGGNWVLIAGPGWEDAVGEDRDALFRAGISYEFEAGEWTLAPIFQVDFVENEEILVYGLNIGRGW